LDKTAWEAEFSFSLKLALFGYLLKPISHCSLQVLEIADEAWLNPVGISSSKVA
jgi:hypothetical protein